MGNIMINNKQVTEKSPFSIFHQEWWLNAATDGHYDLIEVKKDGLVIGDLAIFMQTHLGMKIITRPPYTRTLGPRLFLPPSKPFRRAQNIRNTIAELVKKIPPYDSLHISLDPEDETAFAFSLCKFTIGQAFTFRVPLDIPLKDVWDNCDQKTRNLIRTADKKLSVVCNTNLDDFIRISLIDQPRAQNSHDFARMKKIFDACCQREQACVMSAWDEHNQLIAAVVLIWDQNNLYFWQSARDRGATIAGSNMLLIWQSIEYAHNRGLTFDFDSFASAKSAKMIASFGLPPIVRPQVLGASILRQRERSANGTLKIFKNKILGRAVS